MSGLPHTLTLLTTDRCTAKCRDCGVGATPGGVRRLSREDIYRYIDAAACLGVRLIVFSGGEPFLLGKDLDDTVKYAACAGLLTRFVSNGYWAVSKSYALERLGELQRAGLCEVNFSTGDIHQQYVPVRNVINGVLAAARLGMTCAVMIELHKSSLYTRETFLGESEIAALRRNPVAGNRLFVLESPWVDMTTNVSPNPRDGRLLTRETLGFRIGCHSIIGGIAVDPDGSLGACCGITRRYIPELTVGSLKSSSMAELTELVKRDFMKRWLFSQGPEHILAWAAEQDPEIRWEGKYVHQCHACQAVYNDPSVRAVVAKNHRKKLVDVNLQYYMLSKYAHKKDQGCRI